MKAFSVGIMRTHPDGSMFGERHYFCQAHGQQAVVEYAQLEEAAEDLGDAFTRVVYEDERGVKHSVGFGPTTLDRVATCETCGLGLDKRGYVTNHAGRN